MALLIVWDRIIVLFNVTPEVVPRPGAALAQLWYGLQNGVLLSHTWVTLQEVIYGFAIGTLAGFIVGVLVAEFPYVRMAVYPFLIVLQITPKVAIAPLFIMESDAETKDVDGVRRVYRLDDLRRLLNREAVRLVDESGLRFAVELSNLHGYGRVALAMNAVKIALRLFPTVRPLGEEQLREALALLIGPTKARVILTSVDGVRGHRAAAVAAG